MNSVFIKWVHRFFWLLIFIFVVALVASGYFIYKYLHSRGLSIEIKGPTEINLGVPFDLEVDFNNQAENILKDARLDLNLPEGAVIAGMAENQRIVSENLGDIGIGTFSQKTFHLLMTGNEDTVKRFTAIISYESPGLSRVRFEQKEDFDLQVKAAAVSLDFTLPAQTISGEKFDIKISYHNLSGQEFPETELEVDYPPNFSFESASFNPSQSNKIWNLGNLASESNGELIISGRAIGPSKSFLNFGVKLTMNYLGRRYLLNQKSANLSIASSPVELFFSLNGQENITAQLSEQLNYVLNYKNNSEASLSDVVIKIQLLGDLFDFNSLKTNAGFNSLTNTLTWDAGNQPELRVVSAGSGGNVSFELKTKNDFPIKRLGDKNYLLKATAEIESPTVPYFLTADKTTSLANLETKVAGIIKIASKGYFRDAASQIINRGPWPPKVNQPTQYTIHWLIANFAVDVRNVEVRAFLEPGIKWTGKVKSNVSALPVYNERTQEIVWLIDKIQANKGVVSQPVEAIFQVEATPNINQAGNYLPVIKQAEVTAFDEFSETRLQDVAPGINTFFPDDLTLKEGEGIVQQ